MTYEITQSPERNHKHTSKYPILKLKIGERFFVKGKTCESMSGTLYYHRNRLKELTGEDRYFATEMDKGGCWVSRITEEEYQERSNKWSGKEHPIAT